MPIVVVSRADDEIADLIDRVRTAGDPDIGLVVPPGSRALQTPLNARLLSQYCRNNSVRVAIISEDQRIQQVAATIGFTAYATQLAYERGIELLPPRAPAGVPTELGAATTAVAVEAAPPRVTSATAAAPTGAPPQPPRPEPRRVLQVPAPAPRSVGRD